MRVGVSVSPRDVMSRLGSCGFEPTDEVVGRVLSGLSPSERLPETYKQCPQMASPNSIETAP